MQTLRIATDLLSTSTPEDALLFAPTLEKLSLKAGLRFINLGTTSSVAYLQNSTISRLACSLQYTSFTISWNYENEWDIREARILADEIFLMAENTPSTANFRFAVAFNCQSSSTPYFPAACADPIVDHHSFALGMENSGLLYHAIERTIQNPSSSSPPPSTKALVDAIHSTFNEALQPIQTIAYDIENTMNTTETAKRYVYSGVDTSVAPSLDPPSIADSFELIGTGRFGHSGTLSLAERITFAIKSLALDVQQQQQQDDGRSNIKSTGYCGLMLPVCEDQGLSLAASKKDITIQSLLTYSAVCGIGLDTVPIAGPCSSTSKEERKIMVDRVAGLLLDTASLAQRLNKPLSVRLLPIPGSKGGDRTNFENPFLTESVVMDV